MTDEERIKFNNECLVRGVLAEITSGVNTDVSGCGCYQGPCSSNVIRVRKEWISLQQDRENLRALRAQHPVRGRKLVQPKINWLVFMIIFVCMACVPMVEKQLEDGSIIQRSQGTDPDHHYIVMYRRCDSTKVECTEWKTTQEFECKK